MRAVGLGRAAVAVALAAVTAAAFDLVVIAGGSMSPTVADGDVVVVAVWADPAEGDVVLVEPPDREPFVHRVLISGGGMLITQGDANPTPDSSPVPEDQVAGVVVAVIPTGRGW